jgi:hypothetical protein
MPPLLPASPLTSTAAVVRELLLAAGGAPQRMSQLFAAANAAVGPLSRTHFREAIVAGMFARGELRKQRVVPAAAAAAGAGAGASGGASSAGGAAAASSSSSSSAAELRPFFGITLAPSAKARALVREARAPGGKLAATLAAVAAARARAVPAPAAAAVAAVAVKAAAAAPEAAAPPPPPLR